MTRERQSTLDAAAIVWPALRNHIPCMAHVIQLALGAFMSSQGVKGRTKYWEAHECDQQFGGTECTDIRKSQRLRNVGNATNRKVSAMNPGLAKMIEKVHITSNFEIPETNLHIAGNASRIDDADTGSLNRVHRLLKSDSMDSSSTHYRSGDMVELDIGGAWGSLPITRIHLRVPQESRVQWVTATFHSTRWPDHHQARYGGLKAIPIVDPVNVEKG